MTSSTTHPVRIISTAQAISWTSDRRRKIRGSKRRLARVLGITKQALSQWGEWPPKFRQWELEQLMADHPNGPTQEMLQ